MIKEYNDETHVVLSRDTYEQLKAIAQDNMILRPLPKQVAELKELLTTYKVNFELLSYCVMGLTGAFGLNNPENTSIRPGILLPDTDPDHENAMPKIIKAITSLMTDAMLAEHNKAKAQQMAERFHFFQYLPIVVDFYEKQKAIKMPIPQELMKALPPAVQNSLV